MEIPFSAPPEVLDVLGALGRTEDVRFSPSNRRLAVAAFGRNRIAVFDVSITTTLDGTRVSLPRVVEIESGDLNCPHGLDFIAEDILVVSNRGGSVPVFQLPQEAVGGRVCELSPVHTVDAGNCVVMRSPGSVSAFGIAHDRCELLICDNDEHVVTRHVMDWRTGWRVSRGAVLLAKWLSIPDGVCVSPDRQWIAISNHSAHHVLVYANSPDLNAQTDPDGVLRAVQYPHGLRFSTDAQYLFVADAGAPYVHVYAQQGRGWQGVRQPVTSFRVMDESVFSRGRHNPQEGGPKGLDIDQAMRVLVVTSGCQPLAFFDVATILADPGSDGARQIQANRDQDLRAVGYELGLLDESRRIQAQIAMAEARAVRLEDTVKAGMVRLHEVEAEVSREKSRVRQAEARAELAEAEVALAFASWSWRLTAPLRRAHAAFRKWWR